MQEMGVKVMNPVIFHECPKWAALSLPPKITKKSQYPSPKFFMSSTHLHFHTKLFYCLLFYKSTEAGNVNKKTLGSGPAAPRSRPRYYKEESDNVDEIFKSMEDWATHNILPLLKPAKDCWQPQDFLPDPSSPGDGFYDQIKQLQARTKDIPDDYFVVLVGNMITEEALPSYHSRLNSTRIFHDNTGIDTSPWAVWARGWSAEENRHGDLLNKYLYLSARVDMKQVETTIQYLIATGLDVGISSNPYVWTIYTSFQERATAICHGNTAKMAVLHGEAKLAQICGIISSDEKRHAGAYTKMAGKLFELDPNEMLLAFAYMMRRKISMPAHLMYDGHDHHLFHHFSSVASRIGVYTASEYRGILEHFLGRWNVEKLAGLSSEGREAQEYVCGLPRIIRKLEERAKSKAEEAPPVPFSWIFHRKV